MSQGGFEGHAKHKHSHSHRENVLAISTLVKHGLLIVLMAISRVTLSNIQVNWPCAILIGELVSVLTH